MLKTEWFSRFIVATATVVSTASFAPEAIAAPLYLKPGETATVTSSYEVWSGGRHEEALVTWRFDDFYWGALQFTEGSLFETSSDGTRYAITNDAISSVGIYRENAKVEYLPLSAQSTPGGETTAGLVDWSSQRQFGMELGVQTLDVDSLFELITQNWDFKANFSPQTLEKISSIQDMHNLHIGEVSTTFYIGGHNSVGSREIYLDLSSYVPPADESQKDIKDVPEPSSVMALLGLAVTSLASTGKSRKFCRG